MTKAPTTRPVWRGPQGLKKLLVPIGLLAAHPSNPRKHDLPAIKASLEALGQQKPIVVVPAGRVHPEFQTIVAGHGTTFAARELGWSHVAAVESDLEDVDIERFVLADNRTSDRAGYDDELLARLLGEVQDRGGLVGTGYSRDDLDALLADLRKRSNTRDPDSVPEPPTAAKSERGAVYELGPHRLMCGDATDSEQVASLTDGQVFSALVTDPPYGIEREGIANDDPRKLRAMFDQTLSAAPLKDAVVVAFQSPRLVIEWLDAVRRAGHHFERLLWMHRAAAKTYPWRGWVLASDAIAVSSVGKPRWPAPHDFCHDTYVKTTLEDASLTGQHSTIKPVAIIQDIVSKIPKGPVYEPFAGSGTTLIAAERLARRCFAMEIDPAYCDVIRKRYADFTDQPEFAP